MNMQISTLGAYPDPQSNSVLEARAGNENNGANRTTAALSVTVQIYAVYASVQGRGDKRGATVITSVKRQTS